MELLLTTDHTIVVTLENEKIEDHKLKMKKLLQEAKYGNTTLRVDWSYDGGHNMFLTRLEELETRPLFTNHGESLTSLDLEDELLVESTQFGYIIHSENYSGSLEFVDLSILAPNVVTKSYHPSLGLEYNRPHLKEMVGIENPLIETGYYVGYGIVLKDEEDVLTALKSDCVGPDGSDRNEWIKARLDDKYGHNNLNALLEVTVHFNGYSNEYDIEIQNGVVKDAPGWVGTYFKEGHKDFSELANSELEYLGGTIGEIKVTRIK